MHRVLRNCGHRLFCWGNLPGRCEDLRVQTRSYMSWGHHFMVETVTFSHDSSHCISNESWIRWTHMQVNMPHELVCTATVRARPAALLDGPYRHGNHKRQSQMYFSRRNMHNSSIEYLVIIEGSCGNQAVA